MNEKTNNIANRNPYTIWFVVLAFVAPAALAYFLYFFGNIGSFTNHGEILNPVVDIASLQLKDEKGELIPRKSITYKWRAISFVDENCDEACNSRLYDIRQVHKSLAKNQHRVLRMIVHLQVPSDALIKLIEQEYPNAINVFGDEKTISAALGNSARVRENEIYLMDPMGNVMMRFTQDQPKKDLLKDLHKLLKASQIG